MRSGATTRKPARDPETGLGLPVLRMRRRLLRWYDANKRNWPWRRTRDPYRIWVAEVMLQQTRVETVEPAYRRFLRAFPTLRRLAEADEDAVLAAWSGLGYYARARALHRAARLLTAGGRTTFPGTMAEALALPGVGPYTAAAVLSIAYGLPRAALDGNVARVLSRLACLAGAERNREAQRLLAERLIDKRRPGDWNQALMELGQAVCLPRRPRCHLCPLSANCRARRLNSVDRYPGRPSQPPSERLSIALTLIRDRDGRLLLERGAFPYLPHLWLPPVTVNGQRPRAHRHSQACGSFRHSIQRWVFEVQVFARVLGARELERYLRIGRQPDVQRRIFTPEDIDRVGRSSLLTKSLACWAEGVRSRDQEISNSAMTGV